MKVRFLAVLTAIFMLTTVMAYAAAPTVKVTVSGTSITPDGYLANGGMRFRVTFSQPVQEFDVSEIEFKKSSGSIEELVWDVLPINQSGNFANKYDVWVDFFGNGRVSVKVPVGIAQNAGGEDSTSAQTRWYPLDTRNPRVSYISAPSSTSGSFPAILGLSEQSYLMDESAIQVIGASSWTLTNPTDGLINQLRLQITPVDGVTEVRISVDRYCFIDKGGNYNPRSMKRTVNIQ